MPRGIYNRKNRRTREADLGLGKSVAEVTSDDPNAATPPEPEYKEYKEPNWEPVYQHTMGPAAATRAANPEATAAKAAAAKEPAPPKPPKRTRRRRLRRAKRQATPRDMSQGIAEGLAQVLKNFEAQNLQHVQQQIKHLEGRLSAVEQAGTNFKDAVIAGLNRH